jgi:methylated-DNA-[protein]-cysteine S-methyltransferase
MSRPLPDIADAALAAGLVDVAYVVEASPLGDLLLAATPRGLVRIAYLGGGEGDAEGVVNELAAAISPRVLRAPARLDPARRELDEFFAGRRRGFDLPLDWRLVRAGFMRRVLAQTARIPYGAVSSYGSIAAAAGSPRAFRAAGTALGGNPIPIVVPCHRVLHAGGGLGGYAGGLERKRLLLELELRGHD